MQTTSLDATEMDNANDRRHDVTVDMGRVVASFKKRYGSTFWHGLTHLIGDHRPQVVLDLGCGHGLFLEAAVRRHGVRTVHGVDVDAERLRWARERLHRALPPECVHLHLVDLNTGPPPLPPKTVGLAFSGLVFHELRDPTGLLRAVLPLLSTGGTCVTYDYVSCSPEAFVSDMAALGVSPKKALQRHPRMCRHSLEDLEGMYHSAGYDHVTAIMVGHTRALVAGRKT